MVYQRFIAMYDNSCQICCNWSNLTPKYHAADKNDTPPSHFKLTLGQSALLYALNGEPYLGEAAGANFSVFDLTPTGDSNPFHTLSERSTHLVTEAAIIIEPELHFATSF